MFRLLLLFLFIQVSVAAQNNHTPTPDELYGKLFIDVQMNRIFPDSKTFVDCIPLFSAAEILNKYEAERTKKDFDLKEFVLSNFQLPAKPKLSSITPTKDIKKHIQQLWKVLKRPADTVSAGSLLPLPYAYIVPGGRFREIYYWDSYFTMLGLKESKEYVTMENMVNNFAYLVNKYKHIPNGNRSYYLSRSQPPFFSCMVALLASVKGEKVYQQYQDALMAELSYWTSSQADENAVTNSIRDIEVTIGKDVFSFSRYCDDRDIPRQESYYEDVLTAEDAALAFRKMVRYADSNKLKHAVDSIKRNTWHNLRSAAASGWDFSSRWLMSGDKLYNTEVLNILPVDLNCLLYHLQLSVKRSSPTHDPKELELFTNETKKQFRKAFFNETLGWYCDMNIDGTVMNNASLAGMYPLFFKLADKKDVPRIVDYLKQHFLKKGGVVTSQNNSGQQWDAPNGWAPLQWITIIGLENYGYHTLAQEIAKRWINLNKKVFLSTGRLMEKYDVIDTSKPAGGGEYPSQDGFGWTNGVLLALMNKYNIQ